MTEHRYFYRDPLEAAWMAKHYGMRFSPMLDPGEINWFCQYPQRGVYSGEWEPLPPSWDRYFVHLESVQILDPQEMDTLYGPCGGEYFRVERYPDSEREISSEFARQIIQESGFQIIQRWRDKVGPVAFHWPESEPA